MKQKLLLISFFATSVSFAQVGIGTTDPQADLDVRTTNPSAPDAAAGIAIPQVDALPTTGNRAGQLVYFTTVNRYYYYDGVKWLAIYQQVHDFGDMKYSLKTTDHQGWVLLNGRSVSALTPSQQAAATLLGFGESIPNLSDKTLVGSSVSKPLGFYGGNSTVIISQNQLPDVTLSTSTNGAHTHGAGSVGNYNLNLTGGITFQLLNASTNTAQTTSSGSHSHTTSSINGGVTQETLNIQNPYMAANGFIYLGE